jgi:predicted secreted hydrolase
MDHEFSTSALGPELVGWDWIKRALSQGWALLKRLCLKGGPDPEPAKASRRQHTQKARPGHMPVKRALSVNQAR